MLQKFVGVSGLRRYKFITRRNGGSVVFIRRRCHFLNTQRMQLQFLNRATRREKMMGLLIGQLARIRRRRISLFSYNLVGLIPVLYDVAAKPNGSTVFFFLRLLGYTAR